MTPGFNALASGISRIYRHCWCLAGKPINKLGISVMRRNAGVALWGVQAKLLLCAIKISRPVESALNDPWFFVAGGEVDRVRTLVLKRTVVARARLVDGNAFMRLSGGVIGLAFALALLIGTGLVLLGGLLGLLGLLLRLLARSIRYNI